MRLSFVGVVALLVACGGDNATTDGGPDAASDAAPDAAPAHTIKTVFLILMENHNWSDISGSASAPYINSLVASGAHAEKYFNPPNNHPSEPNYLWLEAGKNFGIADDNPPATNHQSTTAHLVNQLEAANVSWKAYEEDITAGTCPLTNVASYAPKHCAFVFFDDVTNTNSPTAQRCITHVVPYKNLAADLAANTVSGYVFITPNLCDDMHDTCAPLNDSIKQGDTWLSTEVPKIQASQAYTNGGVILITWDESEGGDFPIGMIAVSSLAKPKFTTQTPFTHSSTLRTVQEIFGVTPLLGDAANATDLSEMFTSFP